MGNGRISRAGGLAALATGLALIATPAVAQERHGRDYDGQGGWRVEGGGDPRERGGRDGGQMQREQAQAQAAQRDRAAAEANRGQGWRDGQRSEAWQQQRAQQQQVQRQGWRDGQRSDNWRDRSGQQQFNRQGWRDGNREGWRGNGNRYVGNNQRWDNSWRRDRRYDWSGYRSSNRDVYRFGRYRSPYNNWSYRRLSIGFSLQPLFYSSSYWIDDPYTYRLPPAYGPYRWVRYYDDALLVNIYTGEVVDTIYDIFW